MKITNRHSLPEALVHALSHDRYNAGHGDISCTTLIGPAKIRILKEQHKDELTEDAADRIWSMIGSAVHYIIENAVIDMKEKGVWDDATHIAEERYYAEVGGKMISAQIDLKEQHRLIDFKVTSVWSVKNAIYEGGKDEWIQQLNIQRYLMWRNGIEDIHDLYIMAICRDWNKSGQLNDSDYPPRGCMIEIPVWPYEKTEQFIQERLNAHYSKYVPPCTPDEMWEKPPVHALMKEGRKSALRLGASQSFLMDYAKGKGWVVEERDMLNQEDLIALAKGYYFETRPGKRNRCEGYCDVAPFCDQYKEWMASKE